MDHFGERGAGSGTVQQLHAPDPQGLDRRGCGSYALVVALGQDDAAARAPSPLV
jgi:hypothetical protein